MQDLHLPDRAVGTIGNALIAPTAISLRVPIRAAKLEITTQNI